jgi:hypothetical protein
MTNSAKTYNIAVIRELLQAAFNPQTLHRFCLDRPLLKPIVDQFGPGQGEDDMVDEVLDYCETQLLWDELLAAVEEDNPRQYARFKVQLIRGLPSAPRAERPSRAQPGRSSLPLDHSATARAVVAILLHYMEDGVAGLDAGVEDAGSQTAAEIHRLVRARFDEELDGFYAQTLRRFEKKPDRRKGALQEALAEILESDREFARSLNALLQEADEASADAVFNVAIYGAQVGEIINIGELDGHLIIQEGSAAGDE